MRVGLYYPSTLPESFRVCAENIAGGLADRGVEILRFECPTAPPDVDLLWDPRAGGGNPPQQELLSLAVPLVVTLHGVAPMAIPLREYYGSARRCFRGWRRNRRKKAAWRAARGAYAAVITVSRSSRDSILANLPIPATALSWCYNAVDHSQFIARPSLTESDYLLHVSNNEPRKNVDRICEAYRQLPREGRPRLLLKLPADTSHQSGDGITVISRRVDDAELLSLYQNALAFVFPSSFEGFGLPIVEAMASGCPVITSNTHACKEVAGDAALLVDPGNTAALADAMRRVTSHDVRARLRGLGLQRAGEFRWSDAARHYHEVFSRVLG